MLVVSCSGKWSGPIAVTVPIAVALLVGSFRVPAAGRLVFW